MRWIPGRQRQARQAEPQQAPPDRDQQLREAFSPWAAGLTGDKTMSWDRFLHEELGVKPDEEPGPASPAAVADVPPPRPAPEGREPGTLNLVALPFPGDQQWRQDEHGAEDRGQSAPEPRDQPEGRRRVASPVIIRRSGTRTSGYVAVVRNEVVELPDGACRCAMPACRSGWPEDAPLIYPDPEPNPDAEAG